MRVLVGGVGYRNLRDHSVGVAVADRLAARSWSGDVTVEDLSYNPIALVQRLEDEPEGRRFDRMVVVAGVSRPGRVPGTVEAYRWDGVLPSAEAVQGAVAEAVTGVVSVDNTLVVARQFGALPAETIVVEVEPGNEEFGEELSPAVAAAMDAVCERVAALALGAEETRRLPLSSLGGGRLLPPVAR